MQFDPENPVVKLCSEGMNAEALGKKAEARELFKIAWESATNDFEAFTAAHFFARQQDTPEENLYWNLVALERANAVTDADVSGALPSLYLNVGKSYEDLHNIQEAQRNYLLAKEKADALPAGKYGEMIKSGINEALKRTKAGQENDMVLKELIDVWCERRSLKPLSIILPAYLGNLGTEQDINKLISAMSYLCATPCLNEEEQEILNERIAKYSALLR
jgi:hypothetical protein